MTPTTRNYATDPVAGQLLDRTIVETVLAPGDGPRALGEILFALQALDRAAVAYLPGLTIDHVAGAVNRLEHDHRVIIDQLRAHGLGDAPRPPRIAVRLPDRVAT